MNAGPMVQCGQCPLCKTYVPIPTNLLPPPPRPVVPSIYGYNNVGDTHLIHRGVVPVGPLPMPPAPPVTDNLSQYEVSWRSKFLELPVLIHGIVQIVLAALILLLEIVSLGLSRIAATGAGIWCNLVFMTTAISTVLLVKRWDRSRVWATRVVIEQIVLIVFCFIMIGIVGDFVSTYGFTASSTSSSSYSSADGTNFSQKYEVMRAQLAFVILLLFSGITAVVFYGVVTYLTLWKPFNTLDTPHLFHE